MNIRPASTSDIPNIIKLLKASLGESLMPKSEAYWQWKHINNPFGASPVWVAEEAGELIGVRAFMQWNWEKEAKIYRAIRAVDTATDPNHQGKGIFKKLTLGLLEQCEAEGIHLVYNTPNNQSKPGYLKMGWEEVGKLPIQISIKKPIRIAIAKLKGDQKTEFLELPNPQDYNLEKALIDFNFKFEPSSEWNSKYSLDYLKWRYQQIPIIPYYAHFNTKACVIFRLKAGGLGVELRVCDVFGDKHSVEQLLDEIYYQNDFDYMSISGFESVKLPGILKQNKNLGPDVTIRTLAEKDLDEFRNFKNWYPTLGDLEVF
ncbi:GNAT family N-acetyltransferase [Marivirga arenosa]|uniref:GNAT family N-acetyltransferase n=1 Tax=Marivirga arenosa TaxID=3059076 RepID=A0AA51X3P4_9BACT|nr:GNAT family N-acetyltransferase [Marivirga sp. BKB1-2]WNB16868.1 GNAT family N-acetyltransferase [Marivirga sp. BKB1-2]